MNTRLVESRRPAAAWLLVLLAAALGPASGCSRRQAEQENQPQWVVELARAATASAVRRQLAWLERRLPGGVEAAVTADEEDGREFFRLVSTPPLDQAAAEKLRDSLSEKSGARLRLVQVEPERLLDTQALTTEPVPGEPLLEAAAWLPAPAGRKLAGVALADEQARACLRLRPLVPGFPGWLCLELQRLGLARLALAAYRDQAGDSLLVLAATSAAEGTGQRDMVLEVAQMLGRHVTGRRHRGKRFAAVEPARREESPRRALPWGEAEVWTITDLDLRRRRPRRRAPRRQLRQAWLAELPGGGIWLALARDFEPWQKLLEPEGLGLPAGLSVNPQLVEALRQGAGAVGGKERLAGLAVGPLVAAWPLWPRREPWARALAATPTVRLSFVGGEFAWTANLVRLGTEEQARQAYQRGFVEPRQRVIQKLLERSRRVRYEMGLRLVEIGDVRGWHFRGARRGREQLLYFQKGNAIAWLAAPQGGTKAPELPGLLERTELLGW